MSLRRKWKTSKKNKEERRKERLSGKTGRRHKPCFIGRPLPTTRSGNTLRVVKTHKMKLNPYF